MTMNTLPVFSGAQVKKAKLLLATQVASMMGRPFEEGDWSKVYCGAKGIPLADWSNLHIDVSYKGLGVEQKRLRVSLNGKPLRAICGTIQMHPSATRSIRIDNFEADADAVMKDVFRQYEELIRDRTERVKEQSPGARVDMRVGWLIWESTLSEFLYFEERMLPPDPRKYFAEWSSTPARGARKSSKSLWIYERSTKQKRYSVTTSAGIKVQPYFDIPPPSDPNLYYFRVQSEPVDDDTVIIWVAASTARALERQLGQLNKDNVSTTIIKLARDGVLKLLAVKPGEDLAVPISISLEAHRCLMTLKGAGDEHRAQLLLKALT